MVDIWLPSVKVGNSKITFAVLGVVVLLKSLVIATQYIFTHASKSDHLGLGDHKVSQSYTRFYKIPQGFTRFHWKSSRFIMAHYKSVELTGAH